jgi:competence protein ComEC
LYAVYYLPLVILVLALSHWRPLALSRENQRFVLPMTMLQLLLIALLILHPLNSARANGRLHVDFLDVGQGDSALVTMPDGTTMLVDGGGNIFDATRRIGETVVSEYLWWRGLDAIDYVLVTHADADHIDGLNDVLKNFTVRNALIARAPVNDPEFSKFSETLKQTNTKAELLQTGDVIHFGDAELDVLWPPAGGETSTNNDSLVLRLKFGERVILLTGDIEANPARGRGESPAPRQQDFFNRRFRPCHHSSIRRHLGRPQLNVRTSAQRSGPTLAIPRRHHPHDRRMRHDYDQHRRERSNL